MRPSGGGPAHDRPAVRGDPGVRWWWSADPAGLGGFKIALDALEGLRRQWACELGTHGIRVVTLKTGGVPESIPDTFPGKAEISAGAIVD